MPTKYDIQITPGESGDVLFSVRGKAPDTGLMLLQRLYVLLFSPRGKGYRGGGIEYDLLALLEGANTPTDEELNALLALGCAYALEGLDDEDRALVDSFTCSASGGAVSCTLVLSEGTTIEGQLTI